jgi:hypothetical protein
LSSKIFRFARHVLKYSRFMLLKMVMEGLTFCQYMSWLTISTLVFTCWWYSTSRTWGQYILLPDFRSLLLVARSKTVVCRTSWLFNRMSHNILVSIYCRERTSSCDWLCTIIKSQEYLESNSPYLNYGIFSVKVFNNLQ